MGNFIVWVIWIIAAAACIGSALKVVTSSSPFSSALALILEGRVRIAPFVERRPLSSIDAVFTAIARHELTKRPVLVPDHQFDLFTRVRDE